MTESNSHKSISANIGIAPTEDILESIGGRMIAAEMRITSHPQKSIGPRLIDLSLILTVVDRGNEPIMRYSFEKIR
jgi:hypothetical protein